MKATPNEVKTAFPPRERFAVKADTDGSAVGCLFRCLHCGQHILHVDLD
ncbi:CbrC family protein [Neisseria sp. oral taxon 020]|nr:CbrC family protein [Neisseria sp. oral taxon 020]